MQKYVGPLMQALYDAKRIAGTKSIDERIRDVPTFARARFCFTDDPRLEAVEGASLKFLRLLFLPSASAALVERLNSVGTNILTLKRNRMGHLRFEKMVIAHGLAVALESNGFKV